MDAFLDTRKSACLDTRRSVFCDTRISEVHRVSLVLPTQQEYSPCMSKSSLFHVLYLPVVFTTLCACKRVVAPLRTIGYLICVHSPHTSKSCLPHHDFDCQIRLIL